ncbi:hypothetical protein FRUB_09299 [Fimbriiglobus ruber]|uniref:Uncharacterized protein n=1 Tax=Fimbriiglobus ruber TaxID=1908690 RepID=A0A225DH71_9BACT|nr:hypothetical protein FRUB_09299 [Fimbriiglobus ruber]
MDQDTHARKMVGSLDRISSSSIDMHTRAGPGFCAVAPEIDRAMR